MNKNHPTRTFFATRRSLSIALLALLPSWGLAVAQLATRRPRVAVVSHDAPVDSMTGPEAAVPTVRAFYRGMRDFGWVDGKTVTMVVRSADGDLSLLPGIFRKLTEEHVDVIVTSGVAVPAALAVTSSVPVVSIVDDPVKWGFASTLARPGGNFTGLTGDTGISILAKRLQLLKEFVPPARRVAVLDYKYVDATKTPGTHMRRVVVDAAAASLGLLVTHVGADVQADLSNAFEAIASARVDMLMVNTNRATEPSEVVRFEKSMRLPAIHDTEEAVRAGALMTYAADYLDLCRRSAEYVDKILRGAKAGDLPIAQPTKFALILNRTTARTIGLDIPKAMLLRVDEIIE